MLFLLQASLPVFAQAPATQWIRKYGGSAVDIPFSIKTTADGGTITVGYTSSRDGDVHSGFPRDYWDLWVVKLDRCGNIQWEQSWGGTGYESARDVLPTADGGYLVVGETNSTDGNVVNGFGGTKDVWVLKLDANGNLQWQKRYGGNGLDIGNHVSAMEDGGFLIAATTSSNDGDVHGSHGSGGYTDGWLLKISSNGALLWSKCWGGSKNEELLDIEIMNGRLYVMGYANSTDGDVPPQQKNYDVWLLALDLAGNKIFSKVYGGSQNDVAYSMARGGNGTLCMAGYTTSADGDVSGAKGGQDFWVLNVNAAGTIQWQRTLGGADADYANTILADADGGYLVGGISYSSNGDVTNSRGEGDYWVVKMDAAGNTNWQQSWGGGENDHLRAIAWHSTLKEYYLAGDSDSNNGDFTVGRGETDFTILKLKDPERISRDTSVCNTANFSAPPDTLADVCGYDSVVVSYRPVLLQGPFAQQNKRDTIFEGNTLTLPGETGANIRWAANPTLSCTQCAQPVARPVVTTVYTAERLLEGCSVADQFTVVVLKEAVLHLPNAFTPNGDGYNDVFGPEGKVPDEFLLQVYNRYGELVFRSSSTAHKWDGRYKGIPQPYGVFTYFIQFRDTYKKMQQRKGTFVLLR